MKRPGWMDDPVYRKLDGEVDRGAEMVGHVLGFLFCVIPTLLGLYLLVRWLLSAAP